MMRPLILAGLVLASCSAAAPAPTAVQTLDPLAFFTGNTSGKGSLKIVFRSPIPLRVETLGKPDGRGGMTLEQTVREGIKPPRQRRWVLRPTSPTTMVGTVTDTPGPIHGRLAGNQLYLDYTMKGGLRTHQVLTLQPGGRTMVNHMTIRRLGVIVARVEETIRKLD